MNVCIDGGWLVNGTDFIPTDPTDYYATDGLPVIGCSRLRCSKCGAWVKNVAGWLFESADVKVAEVYDRDDPHDLLVKSQPQFRLYYCRCDTYTQQFENRVVEPDFNYLTDKNTTWRCQGHEPVALPHDIDGVRFGSAADIAPALERAARGERPPAAPPRYEKAAWWAVRLHGRFAESPHQAAVVDAAIGLLTHPEPRARAYALAFFALVKTPAANRALVALLDGERPLVRGIRDEVSLLAERRAVTLEDSLWRALAEVAGQSEAVRAIAREDALTPGHATEGVYGALARNDAEWLAEHAEKVVRANPALAPQLALEARHRAEGPAYKRVNQAVAAAIKDIIPKA